MFDSVRKHQRVLLFIIVVLIFPAFAFFGIQGYDRMFSEGDGVARVEGEPITRAEFEQAQREQFDRIRQMFGSSIDPQLFDTPAARREVLEGLIDQRVLSVHARERKITVSDDRLREAIMSIAGLTRPDGTFDLERYRGYVASRGRNETFFESELRRDVAMRELPDALSQSVLVPKVVLDRLGRILAEVREVAELQFQPKDFVAKVQPDEAMLRKYYDERAAEFQVPELATVQYVVLDAEQLAAKISVADADVAAFYEQNRKRFMLPEERRARHILIRLAPDASKPDREAAQARAADLMTRLKKGARFDELAKSESQDPGSARQGGDLDYFTRDMMTGAFAEAVFGAEKGALLGPVETEFGLHLIELTDIRAPRGRTLAEVRDEILAEVRRGQAARRLAEDADAFGNLVYEQPDTLQPAVDRFGLNLEQAAGVGRGGLASLPREHPLNHPRLLAALFSRDSITARRNTEAVDAGGGRIISARILEHQPVRQKPFDEVRSDVQQAVIRDQSRQLALKAGEERLKLLREGGARDGFSSIKPLTRSGQAPLPAPAMEAVFKAGVAKLPALVGVELGEQGYAIYEIRNVIHAAPETIDKQAAQVRAQLEQLLSQQDVADYLDSLKQRADITRSLSRLGAPVQQ
jgi:peptidyl-prolyl cis-trans isomerase D